MAKKKNKNEERLAELQVEITEVNRQRQELEWLISNHNEVQRFRPDLPPIAKLGNLADRLKIEAAKLENEHAAIVAQNKLGEQAKKAIALYHKLADKHQIEK